MCLLHYNVKNIITIFLLVELIYNLFFYVVIKSTSRSISFASSKNVLSY